MDDPPLMGLGETSGDVHCGVDRLIQFQWPPLDLFLYRLAFVVGHGDEDPAVFGLVDLVDVAYIRMVECGSRPRLVYETLLGLVVARKLRREELEGHRAPELCVLGLVDHPHPALPKLLEDFVVRYCLPYHTILV